MKLFPQQLLTKTPFFTKKPERPRNEKLRFYVSVFLLFIVILLESVIMPTMLSASFINRNTAAYMFFDIPFGYDWNAKSEYTWQTEDMVQENINTEWSQFIGEAFVENYVDGFYTDKVVDLIVKETGLDKKIFESAMSISTFNDYTNDFIRMQAGHLVGDNLLPIPSAAKLEESLGKVVALINNDVLNTWYDANKTTLAHSIADAMNRSSDYLMGEAMNNRPAFKESILILKLLNLQIVFYVVMAVLAVLFFCLIKVCDNNKTWISLAITQALGLICALSIYFDLDKIYLVVLGNEFAANQTMIRDVSTLAIIGFAVFVLSIGAFVALHFSKKKTIKSVISKKKG